MKTPLKIIICIVVIGLSHPIYGQSDKEKAFNKAKEAVTMMDNGQVTESLTLLKEAEQLDPLNFDYPYEMAYAHYLQKDYKAAIKILEKLGKHKDITDRYFELLGNSYDNLQKPEKAISVYKKGLENFPSSGCLYLEMGVMQLGKKDESKALEYFEKGIEVEPSFPSNYYWAAKIFCHTTEEVWGMIYGELFMNLERNSQRTAEISQLLFDTYKSEIKFTDTDSFSVSFSQNAAINDNDLLSGSFKLPFGVGVYEPTLMFSMIDESFIDINSLDRIRSRFVDNYYEKGFAKTHPNILFAYQHQIKNAGHMEAYNHWILMKGDEKAFGKWYEANKDKWDSFIKWFGNNALKINATNRFYRNQ